MKKKIFFSYCHQDKEFVYRLLADLKQNNLFVWIDTEKIKAGDSLFDSIENAIQQADHFIFVISHNWSSSNWVQKEFALAKAKELATGRNFIVPIRIDDAGVPPFLRDKLYADFRKSYPEGLEAVIASLGSRSTDDRINFVSYSELKTAVLDENAGLKDTVAQLMELVGEQELYLYNFLKKLLFWSIDNEKSNISEPHDDLRSFRRALKLIDCIAEIQNNPRWEIYATEASLLSLEQTLQREKPGCEKRFGVVYTDETLGEIGLLCERLFASKDAIKWAITFLNLSGFLAFYDNLQVPDLLIEMRKRIMDTQREIDGLAKGDDNKARLMHWKSRYQDSYENTIELWEEELQQKPFVVKTSEVERLMEICVNVRGLSSSLHGNWILRKEEELKENFFGQEDAVEIVLNALRKYHLRMGEENRPIGAFLFMGPTGVGKTQLATEVSNAFFQGAEGLIQIDFSNGFENKMFSTAPYSNFKGSDQEIIEYISGQVSRQPYSMILLEGIEKAGLEVYGFLRKMFATASVRTNQYEEVNFRNTLIVMILGGDIWDANFPIAFPLHSSDGSNATTIDKLSQMLNGAFPANFLSVVDRAIAFSSLSELDFQRLLEIAIEDFFLRLRNQIHSFQMVLAVKEYLLGKTRGAKRGAWSLKSVLDKYLEPPVLTCLMQFPEDKEGVTLVIDYDPQSDQIVVKAKKARTNL